MAAKIQRFMKNLRRPAIWLSISAVSLLVGGFVVRYFLASPTADPDNFMIRHYPLPTDPLNLALKWFVAAFFLSAAGGWLWFRSVRNIRKTDSEDPAPADAGSVSRIVANLVLLPAFWLALVCAVEFSSTEWTFTVFSKPLSEITPEMQNDHHFLIYDSVSAGSDSKMVYHIIPQALLTTTTLMLSRSGYPDAAGSAREGLRAADRRKVAATFSWVVTAILAGAFIVISRRGQAGKSTVSMPRTPDETEPNRSGPP